MAGAGSDGGGSIVAPGVGVDGVRAPEHGEELNTVREGAFVAVVPVVGPAYLAVERKELLVLSLMM